MGPTGEAIRGYTGEAIKIPPEIPQPGAIREKLLITPAEQVAAASAAAERWSVIEPERGERGIVGGGSLFHKIKTVHRDNPTLDKAFSRAASVVGSRYASYAIEIVVGGGSSAGVVGSLFHNTVPR